MPCQGISVAWAKVALENEKYLAMVDQATIDKVIEVYLTSLGYSEADRNFQMRIYDGFVRVTGGPPRLEAKIAQLLDGLAGKMRQQVIIQKLAKAGVKINQKSDCRERRCSAECGDLR